MVSEDLVEQDAKVRLGRLLGWVASGQGQDWWHWDHPDSGLQKAGGCRGLGRAQREQHPDSGSVTFPIPQGPAGSWRAEMGHG